MRVLVTGGAGFIGGNLCRELVTHPGVDEVVVFDDLTTGTEANLEGVGAELVVGSILEPDAIDEVVTRADAVIHLAARPSVPRSVADPVRSHLVNATGTVNVLEACRRRGTHLVAASSSSVYGPTRTLPKHEELPTRPQSPYAASKLAAESAVLAYGATYGLPVLALRFFNVYGPLQSVGHAYAAVIPTFADAALRGQPLHLHGDGRQTRDFTYVGSVARLLTDAVVRRVTSPTPVNLAFGTRTSLLDLVDRIKGLVERPVDVVFDPARPGDVRDSQADSQRLKELFPGHGPVPLDFGLRETVSWYARQIASVRP
ncbi:NAD-dependent epimerase/dehydratase family protein [Dactylosporangium sp. AC04546]|uniref:NAD-dependent epimerase/dehydratase family protein n=1 Tax=Dactylosporangium sp. AC04546 TaxID=2862460 RepID=UPI001EDCAA12|nr:NAD-dependent epimerase/dehydratase family protein [Dactylosporangium sp. AC04546]WVK84338.1 NAD-dependent epimerase/dehydratase family protein [Dactylosporangium sp. AC04546]